MTLKKIVVAASVLFFAALVCVGAGTAEVSGNWKDYAEFGPGHITYDSDTKTFTIYSAEGLAWMANEINNGSNNSGSTWKLSDTANIDLGAHEWTPIGTGSKSFVGNFDGNGRTISNLYINSASEDGQGLFGRAESRSTIKNVSLINVNVTSKDCVGGLVGLSYGSVSNCSVSGSVTGTNNVGGLIGRIASGSYGSVSNCYASGSVTGRNYVGGLVGDLCSYNGSVSNCYATASVTGRSYVGGLVGKSRGSVSNCYATASVTGDEYVGGLIGYNTDEIQNSLALNPSVKGDSDVGRVIGYNEDGSVSDCYGLSDMTVEGTDGISGTDINSTDVWNTFPNGIWATSGFDSTNWKLNDGNTKFLLPIPQNLSNDTVSDASHLNPTPVEDTQTVTNNGNELDSSALPSGDTSGNDNSSTEQTSEVLPSIETSGNDDSSKGQTSDVTYTNVFDYTFTIPGTFDFENNLEFTNDVNIAINVFDATKKVTMSVEEKPENGRILTHSDEVTTIGYQINDAEGTEYTSEIFSVTATETGETGETLYFKIPVKPTKAGLYTGKLTFTTTVTDVEA